MIPEIGHFALILALATTAAQSAALAAGARAPQIAAFGRRCAFASFTLTFVAFASLMYAYAGSDFSVVNVFENSHADKPFIYKLTGTWGNHEGSMLLWALVLSGYSALLALASRRSADPIHARALAVQGVTLIAFIAFILFTSNPFERLFPAPVEGQGLNPLLQDIGLALHPPFLYLGYVGFSVPFSYAVAALIEGRIDREWARTVRPWSLAAWSFLTVGIGLGAWWAYYELGWGGWWAWDPVENASFMPWLAGTALIHSIRVVERREALKAWALLLAIAAFSLSLVGTFLVRSGVLTSVHAFALDPERGAFILLILAVAVGGALTLYAFRAGALTPSSGFAPASRETALIANNVLLATACATVFVGTFYPLFIDLLDGTKLSVGAPYFNAVFTPLAFVALALCGLGIMLGWKRADLGAALSRLKYPAAAAVIAAFVVLGFIARERLIGALSIGLIVWLAGATLAEIAQRVKLFDAPLADSARRARGLPRAALGASLAHFGLAVFALGAAGVSLWKSDEVVLLNVGESAAVAGYEITLASVADIDGPNYRAERAVFRATKHDRTSELVAERRFYPVRGMQTTEAGIVARGAGDVYVTFGENRGGGWPVRLHVFPLVGCLWWGIVIAAMGGALALTDRGAKRAPASAPAAARLEAAAATA